MIESFVLFLYILILLVVVCMIRVVAISAQERAQVVEFSPPWNRKDIDPDVLYTIRVLMEKNYKELNDLKMIIASTLTYSKGDLGALGTLETVATTILDQSLILQAACIKIIIDNDGGEEKYN